jgi:hypothetical protein
MSKYSLVFAAVVLLTLIGYFEFPGHTYLQSDSQIYLPMLERLWDPSVFAKEPLALHPHLAFTIYDEVALALRRTTGLDFRLILTLQQLLFRALGILGVYLLARSLQLSMRMALLVTAVFSLGAAIPGPTVLVFEYEPVPRGFALMLVFFAIGLAAQERDLAAGAAGSLAFLYHPPTSALFWIVYACLTLWPTRPEIMRRRIMGLLPLFFASILLFVLSRLQPGMSEAQNFFSRIGPAQEKLQRMRAPYNWVSMWPAYWIWQYLFLWAVSLAAFFRIRKSVSQDARFFLLGLPLLGILSMPLSYLLLEQLKWVVAPQFQFARGLLLVTAMAVITAATAGIKAAQDRKLAESAAWFLIVFAIPVSTRLLDLVAKPGWPLVIVAALAACAAFAVWSDMRKARWSLAPWAVAALAPFFVIPTYGKVHNYPNLHSPELAQLAAWARSSTPQQSVFLFPDAGRDLQPGIFRAESLRAVYVDWKAGGQVNFMEHFGEEWWRRWQETMAAPFKPAMFETYSKLGIDYVVLKPVHRIKDRVAVFSNSRYIVYATNPSVTSSEWHAIPHTTPVHSKRFLPAYFSWN